MLEAHLPGQRPERIGILMLDATRNMLRVKIRPHRLTSNDDAEILRELAAELEPMASDLGGLEVLEWLENTASHTIRLSSRYAVTFMDPEAALDALYIQEVANGLSAESGEASSSPVRAGLGTVHSLPLAAVLGCAEHCSSRG